MEMPDELCKEIESLPPRFWGSVEITYQSGQPLFIKTVKTRKLHRSQEGQNEDYPAR